MNKFLFELVQISIGNRKNLTRSLSANEWDTIYYICGQQVLLGVAFSGIQKLPEEQMPPSELFAKWEKVTRKEKERREKVAYICRKTRETHEKNGFYSCVLMPSPAQVRGERLEVRGGDSKDIDILCWSKDKKDGKRTIVEYVNFMYVSSTHHIKPKVVRNYTDYESGNTPVEVNFKSEYLNCPWYNNRFETWVRLMVESASESDSCQLPDEFYVVYQLLHLYRKFFCEGIRLGHLLEYYYTLCEFGDKRSKVRDGSGEVRDLRLEVMHVIERLGMKKFAGAVMYVLQTVFAMPDEYLICKPNNRNGSFVLSITMQAGEYTRAIERTRMLKHLGRVGHHLYWLKRNRPFITQYPAEMFFELYKRMKG